MSLPVGTLLGPYEILSAVGAGGMGEVYQARDTRLGRIVAIKTVAPQFAANGERRSRFEREALAVSALSHPHICAFYDVGQHGPVDFLVMEYLEGETLDRRLMRGPLPLDEALVLGKQIADALDQVHRRGFTHRDLKPSNIMLSQSSAKLLDFGLAKLESHLSLSEGGLLNDTKTLTVEGTIVGTVQYMAPEQLEGGHVDHRADLFAFGAVLYEMVTGRRAFTGDSIASQIAAILSTEPPPPSASQPLAPLSLDRLIRRCLAKDPDDRWQTARDLLAELIWIADGESEKDGVVAAIAHRRRRRLVWIPASIAGVVVFSSAVTWLVNRPRTAAANGDVVRFWISAPEETAFDASGGFMAVSPDGRFVSFLAVSKTGERSIWLRPLDSTVARPLGGTEGARQPFWSPDSRYMAFAANGILKKIDVTTGSVATICVLPESMLAGSWSTDGTILFSVLRQVLYAVPAAGSVPAPVTKLDLARGDLAHAWPAFLPDGHHFVYLVNSTSADRLGVYVGSLDPQEEPSRILQVPSNALYAPEGYLLYLRQGTLVARSFNARSYRFTGEPVVLAERVAQNPFTKRIVASISSNGVLAYQTVPDTELVWFDRHGQRLATVGPPGQYSNPALSPDDRQVAFSRLDPRAGTEDIWSIDTASGRTRRLTFDDAWDATPVWSPDGARILFQSDRRGGFDLFQTMADGSGKDELLPGSRGLQPRDWAVDGQLAYEPTSQHLVLFRSVAVSSPQVTSTFPRGSSVDEARISPDRNWIAYTSHESNLDEVYVRPLSSTSEKKWQISVRGGTAPRWRADGKALFYLGSDQTIMSVSLRTETTFEPLPPEPLFRVETSGAPGKPTGGFAVSRDGLRFLVNRPTNVPITVVVNWTKSLQH